MAEARGHKSIMDKPTFEALKSLLAFLEGQIGDVPLPVAVEEDVAQVGGWIEEVAKDFE